MADVRPFRALHYNLNAVGSLASVTAPPYDVISPAERRKLLQHSPFNVVEIDLPVAVGEGSDPYQHAAETLEEWTLNGILTQDRKPGIWALSQEYTGPDGSTHTRNSIIARVAVTDYGPGRIRPHERTQPGPKQDRLDLTRATRYNLSPIFSLTSRDAWPQVAAEAEAEPWATVSDDDGTTHRLWPITDPVVHAAVTEVLEDAELLIADGHHRYETARAYMNEVAGEGEHCFTLMALTGLDDPGLTVYPTHRLLSGIAGNRDIHDHLDNGLRAAFDFEPTDLDGLDPAGMEGIGCFGFADQTTGQYFRLRLKDPLALESLMEGRSEAYRHLDAAILEKVVFSDLLGMSEADVEAKKGLTYAKSVGESLKLLDEGSCQAAFILRATPIEQVRAVAAAGETMPPKSTYFFPKLLSGMAFNPLS
ncbi:MAG: DUF1015 domain-containing protein [Actinomycetota bacterium]|nr:DUF1015 domain-containing protein [Actinomycetota bacterium]